MEVATKMVSNSVRKRESRFLEMLSPKHLIGGNIRENSPALSFASRRTFRGAKIENNEEEYQTFKTVGRFATRSLEVDNNQSRN